MRFLLCVFLLIVSPFAIAFHSVTGTVTDQQGILVDDLSVSVYYADGTLYRTDWINAGNFNIWPPNTDFYLVFHGVEHQAEAYPNRDCGYVRIEGWGTPQPECSFTGAKLFPADSTESISVVMDRLPVLSGKVTNSKSGVAVADANLCYFYDLEHHFSNCTVSGPDGAYSTRLYPGVKTFIAGQKYAYHTTTSDGARCPSDSYYDWYEECLSVTEESHGFISEGDFTLDFSLDPMAMIRGRVLNAVTDRPFASADIVAFDEALSSSKEQRYASPLGEFLLAVPRGRYKVRASDSRYSSNFFSSLHDNVVCSSSCPATGSTLVLEEGDEVDVGDIFLWPRRGVYGFVTSAGGGRPLEGVIVDVWNSSGEHLDSVTTGTNGGYHSTTPCSSYYGCDVLVSTANANEYMDEVYDDIACPNGPAFQDLCDVMSGTTRETSASSLGTNRADFQLESDTLFENGFE